MDELSKDLLDEYRPGDLTADDFTKAEWIANLSRKALVRRLAKMLAKRRELEAKLKQLKSEAWKRSGWQSERSADGTTTEVL